MIYEIKVYTKVNPGKTLCDELTCTQIIPKKNTSEIIAIEREKNLGGCKYNILATKNKPYRFKFDPSRLAASRARGTALSIETRRKNKIKNGGPIEPDRFVPKERN